MLLKENWGSEFYKQVVKAFQVFPDGSVVKNPPANAGDTDSIPGLRRSLEKEMATHSSITAWRIPWIEEPGRLQSMVWQSVGHDWDTSLQDNLPRFWSISGQFQYFPETESVSQFLQGCLYLCCPHVLLSALPTGDVVASGAIQAW